MTNDAFFDALTACKDQFVWTVEVTGHIRARSHAKKPHRCFCPLTALAMTQGKMVSMVQYRVAAELLGIDIDEAEHLAVAADQNYAPNNLHLIALRTRLLTCLGLEDVRHG